MGSFSLTHWLVVLAIVLILFEQAAYEDHGRPCARCARVPHRHRDDGAGESEE